MEKRASLRNDFPAVEVDPGQPYHSIRNLYLNEEPRLLASIRRQDRREAVRIINLLLVHIYSLGGDGPGDLLKSLLLELVVMMSRAAVEAGAPQEEVLGLRFQHLAELAGISDDEELAAWLRGSVIRIFEAVERCSPGRQPAAVTEALRIIREESGQPLTRDAVARRAGVSSPHLADLLRTFTGRSFTELLREARVDLACHLLRTTELSTAAIAAECGFCDQSYLTHVFQEIKKTTPRAYREGNVTR